MTPPNDADRPRRTAAYSPEGLAEYFAYEAEIKAPVKKGEITAKEGAILCSFRMKVLISEGGVGVGVRRPKCRTCGKVSTIIGAVAQKFRCPCSPAIEQSIADAVRAKRRHAP